MKIQFERQDSFYKITKTVEKIPNGRKVTFVIDSDNNMFANERRGQQLLSLCNEKELHYTIVTSYAKVKSYCDRVGLHCEYIKKSPWSVMGSIIYSFFFKVRDFHYYTVHQRKYVKYLIFLAEALVVFAIMGYVYGMLIPKATISITPAYDIEDVSYNFRLTPAGSGSTDNAISIPYYQGILPYRRVLRTSIQSIRYSAQTAKGMVSLTNSTNREYALKPYTRFITDDNLVFKTNQRVNLPENTTVTIELWAEDVDDKGSVMGIRGNIASGTILYIRNLAESRVRKSIIATALTNFTGGDTLARGVVTQKDIEAFDQLARQTISGSAMQIVRESIKDQTIIPLQYQSMISGTVLKVSVDAKEGDPLLEFDGTVEAQIGYSYIKREDFDRAVSRYFAQRSTQSLRLVSIQPESIKMFDPVVLGSGLYSVPMTVSTLWSYNFDTDAGGIVSQITQGIVGMTKDQARQHILSYPDVSIAKISISPFWYQTIPSIKSRIEFKVIESDTEQAN